MIQNYLKDPLLLLTIGNYLDKNFEGDNFKRSLKTIRADYFFHRIPNKIATIDIDGIYGEYQNRKHFVLLWNYLISEIKFI